MAMAAEESAKGGGRISHGGGRIGHGGGKIGRGGGRIGLGGERIGLAGESGGGSEKGKMWQKNWKLDEIVLTKSNTKSMVRAFKKKSHF